MGRGGAIHWRRRRGGRFDRHLVQWDPPLGQCTYCTMAKGGGVHFLRPHDVCQWQSTSAGPHKRHMVGSSVAIQSPNIRRPVCCVIGGNSVSRSFHFGWFAAHFEATQARRASCGFWTCKQTREQCTQGPLLGPRPAAVPERHCQHRAIPAPAAAL